MKIPEIPPAAIDQMQRRRNHWFDDEEEEEEEEDAEGTQEKMRWDYNRYNQQTKLGEAVE